RDGKDLQRVVAGLPLRQPANVTVIRDGKPVVVPVTIEEQPEEYGTSRVPASVTPRGGRIESLNVGKTGLSVADLTADLAEQWGYKEGMSGAVIARAQQGSLAAEAGLRPGMLLVKVDKKPVASASAAREVLEKASLEKGVLLQVTSPEGGTNFVVLQGQSE